MKFLNAIRYIIVLPILLLTLMTTPEAKSTDTAEFISQDVFVFDQALIMGQGITTDGEYYYTSGAITALNLTALAKIDCENMTVVDTAINPLPKKCTDRGNNHIGGISYYNGKIYASVEGPDEGYPCIVVFDCNLKATGEVYYLPIEDYDDGVPWCAVDPDTGYLYASKWSDAKTIFVYDTADSMKLIKEIPLKGTGIIDRTQGGEFHNGTLYLSYDYKRDGSSKKIMAVDIETGEVSLAAERNVGTAEDIEAEGMTFTCTDDGCTMDVLDYNKLVGVFVRHYKVDF